MTPRVSVVIPAFNSSATIGHALDSVHRQEFPDMEVLVVDDGSSDDTCAVVEQWTDGNLRLIRQSKNQGAAAARNLGIQEARGKYVAFLDSDDRWLPGKLKLQVEALERDRRMSLVTCDCLILNDAGQVLKRTHAQHPPVSGSEAWRALLVRNFIPTPTVIARRECLIETGGFDTSLPVAEDLDLWIRLGLSGIIGVVPEVLVHVYDRPGSLMKRHAADEEQILFSVLDRHLRNQKARFTNSEIRAIRGQRHFHVGAKLFDHRQYRASVRPFLHAAAAGHRPIKSLCNSARALVLQAVTHTSAIDA